MNKIPYVISVARPHKTNPRIEFIQGSESRDTFEKVIIDRILDIMLDKEGNYETFDDFLNSFFEEYLMDNQAVEVKFYDPETDQWYNYLTPDIKNKIFDIYKKIYLAITSSYISNKIMEIYNRKIDTGDRSSTIVSECAEEEH